MARRLLRHAAIGAAGLVVALFGTAVLLIWSIRADLTTAEDRIQEISLETASAEGGLDSLARPVLSSIREADRTAHHPVLDVLGHVPFVSGQVDSLRETTGRVTVVADVAEVQLDRIERAFDLVGEPAGTVALADTLIAATDELTDTVNEQRSGRRSELIGPLGGAQRQLDDALDTAVDRLTELRRHLVTGRDLLSGPSSILVLASNNAEQRAGMGMHLSAGVILVEDGEYVTSDFIPTEELTERTEERAAYPEELVPLFEEIWDYGREWRTVSTTPNYPVVGSVFAQLSEQVGAPPVDAVISVDAIALSGMLQATGPVRVGDQDVRADNVVDLLLRRNYLEFSASGADRERRELQGQIAEAIFTALTDRDIDPLLLASQLAGAADGRHLLAWSPTSDLQHLWETLGADGALDERSLLISVQNASGSKRDYYLDPEMSIESIEGSRPGHHRYLATATLSNPEVEPTTDVIEGTNPLVPQGVHRAYVTFTVPGSATDVEVVAGSLSRMGTDGPTKLVAVWIRVPVGEERHAALEFELPAGDRRVELLPSARVRPVAYTIGGRVVADDVIQQVTLPLPPTSAQEANLPAALALVSAFAGVLLLAARSRRLTGPDPDLEGARRDGTVGLAFLVCGLAAMVLFAV